MTLGPGNMVCSVLMCRVSWQEVRLSISLHHKCSRLLFQTSTKSHHVVYSCINSVYRLQQSNAVSFLFPLRLFSEVSSSSSKVLVFHCKGAKGQVTFKTHKQDVTVVVFSFRRCLCSGTLKQNVNEILKFTKQGVIIGTKT